VTVHRLIPLLTAAALGAGAAVLVSCGSSGVGLIPAQNAGPLLSDFQAVEQAALKGDGDCTATEAALRTTERDFQVLPGSVNAGLHGKLQEGISNLRKRALEMCVQPLAQTTATGTSTSPTATAPAPSSTSTTGTQSAPTSTTPTTSTTETGVPPSSTTQTSSTGGGTAPEVSPSGEAKAEEGAAGNAQGGSGPSGGTGSGSGEQ
jgi:hypothetical protein